MSLIMSWIMGMRMMMSVQSSPFWLLRSAFEDSVANFIAMDVIDVGNDTYVVCFASSDEYERALYSGSWIIADHYLSVNPWYLNFDPDSFTISRLAVWVCFPNLPIEYSDREFLFKIARRIGRPLKIDETTLLASRGSVVNMGTEGRIARRRRTNPIIRKFQPLRLKVGKLFPSWNLASETYGDWMLVKRNQRKGGKQSAKAMTEEQNVRQSFGSRYNTLSTAEEDVQITGDVRTNGAQKDYDGEFKNGKSNGSSDQ
ncbi:hypothetical protein PTKIN_Ptkin14bG0123700 [Pterospermum kingtungense]